MTGVAIKGAVKVTTFGLLGGTCKTQQSQTLEPLANAEADEDKDVVATASRMAALGAAETEENVESINKALEELECKFSWVELHVLMRVESGDGSISSATASNLRMHYISTFIQLLINLCIRLI